jgi:hypothetical protein
LPVTAKRYDSRKHFTFRTASWRQVLRDLEKESNRLRNFRAGCPDSRAREIDRLLEQLRNLHGENPPNRTDENGRLLIL